MRISKFYVSTLKEAPAEADVASQKLMLRAGLIKKLGSGLYTWMPLGLITLRKVERIIREEMNRAGALELVMPVIQPAELWQESGRWEKMGPLMLRLQDRQKRDFIVGPTHEEVITDIVRREIRSYKQLPVNFYQIQTKFRDEIRPRFGVMRAREFVMKDAYSFDIDETGMLRSYRIMYDAYVRIFTRMGLEFRAVDADSGAIGGAHCRASSRCWPIRARTRLPTATAPTMRPTSRRPKRWRLRHRAPPAVETKARVPTPGKSTCEDVAELLQLPLARTVKCLMVWADGRVHMLLLRGDHMGNEVKIGKLPGMDGWRFASEAEIIEATGCRPGYLGPVGIPKDMPLIADRAVAVMADFVCGANEPDYHLRGVNFGRDCREPDVVADIRNVVKGDPSPDGKGTLDILRGIEVGHVFALGHLYSEALGATFLDADGQAKVMEMGCYGIGCTRVVAAAIEQNHDEKGIIWPLPLAPFAVAIAPIGYDRNEAGTSAGRPAARRARGGGRGGAARRPRRASWRDVC